MAEDDLYNRPKGVMSRIQAVLVGVLVSMLVLAFAVWGIEDVFSPNATNAVVKVGDAEVGQPEFMDRFNDEMRSFAEENGEGLTPQQAFDRGIPQRLVSQLVQELAIEADADDLEIGVNNRDVARYVADIDAFRNEITQEFDRTQLQRMLASNRITESEFEQDIINALTQRQTLPAIMGGIKAPQDFAQRYNAYVTEIRRAHLLQINETMIETVAEPTDTQLESYLAANQARFTAPEYRQFLMIRLEPFDFQPDIEVTEEQLRERFETLLGAGEIGATETRDVSVIAVPTEDQANLVAARIGAGEDMQAVTKELNLPAPDAFDGIKVNSLINPEADAAAFAAKQGEARVVPTNFGTFEVVVARTVYPADVPDFESMRDELRKDVLEGEALRKINDYERVIDDRLLEGATLEEIAEAIDAPIASYPFLDRNGQTQDGLRLTGFTTIPGIATDERLMQAIFNGDIGFESDITPTSNNGLAIFRITDIIDSAPRTLDEVRDDVAALWKAEARDDALTQTGIVIANRVRDGEALETVAADYSAEVRDLAIQRASPPNDVSRAVLVNLLDGAPGDIARGPGIVPGTYEVAILDNISSGNERISGQILDIVREQMSEQIAVDISRAYQDAILNDKGQQIFEDQIRAALNLDAEG